jgi:chromosome segregation ATPase
MGINTKAREQTMNELKPEDVVRALDILDKMDFFQGQRAGRELWLEKPFEVQEQDIADFSQGIAFVKNLITNALALLRDKDAEQKDLWEERNRIYQDLQEWKAKCKKYQDAISEKDAEIDMLKSDFEKAQCSVELLGAELGKLGLALSHVEQIARSEAITEFENRLIKYYDALKSGLVAYHIKEVAKELKEDLNAT